MQTQIINLSIPKPLLQALDKVAKREVKTRSEALRDAIRAYLVNRNQLNSILVYGKKQVSKLKISSSQVEQLVDEYRKGR